MLLRYGWPGNVRELQSVLRQSLLQAAGPVLMAEFLPPAVRDIPGAAGGASTIHGDAAPLETLIDERLKQEKTGLYAEALACMESLLLTRLVKHTRGNQSLGARLLGISRSSLRNKLRQLHVAVDVAAVVDEESAEAGISHRGTALPLRTGPAPRRSPHGAGEPNRGSAGHPDALIKAGRRKWSKRPPPFLPTWRPGFDGGTEQGRSTHCAQAQPTSTYASSVEEIT